MGEIKSTLDLVMERTRHLSMTDEEKARQKQSDFENRLNGLLTKYADNTLSLSALRKDIQKLQAELDINDQEIVAEAVLRQIDPDQDNAHWIDLLGKIKPEMVDPLQKMLGQYNDQKTNLLNSSHRQVTDRLAENRQISGSAVIPNPEKNPQCKEQLSTLKIKVQKEIQVVQKMGDLHI